MSFALDALIFATGWAHVVLSPYTKVEESFNIHATHDAFMYGVGSSGLQKVRLLLNSKFQMLMSLSTTTSYFQAQSPGLSSEVSF